MSTIAAAIPVALGVLKVVKEILTDPIVDKGIENLVAGTPTKVDDVLWRALRGVLGNRTAEDPVAAEREIRARPDDIERAVESVQRWYDSLEPEVKEKAKAPVALPDPS